MVHACQAELLTQDALRCFDEAVADGSDAASRASLLTTLRRCEVESHAHKLLCERTAAQADLLRMDAFEQFRADLALLMAETERYK